MERMSWAESHKNDSLLECLEGANTQALCNHKSILTPFGITRKGVTNKMLEIANKYEEIIGTDEPIEEFQQLEYLYRVEMENFLVLNNRLDLIVA